MSVEYAKRYPILTVSSGPTNSIRGAGHLTGLTDGVVVDIGGTTTLAGALVKGFPRASASAIKIGGVRTNFRMPDLVSIGCGGGTIVRPTNGSVRIGPDSVGYELPRRGRAWGGDTLTTTDIALAAGYARIEDGRCDPARLTDVPKDLVQAAVGQIVGVFEESVDKIKISREPVPLVLVGGGGILIPRERYDRLRGVSQVIRPEHFQYANALGAAVAQVSGQIERIFPMEHSSRGAVMEEAKALAKQEAVRAGADPITIEIVDIDETFLAYLPSNAARIRVKAAGKLAT
jgi:N-methylhydantoinase A/oxoprolinase/acetone carboxylase beta subunit